MQKSNENIMKFLLWLTLLFGGYVIVAWASFSPLDSAWSVASSATQSVLNKTGKFGAWIVDLLFAMFGKPAFLLPFGVVFTAAYLLILGLAKQLSGRQISLWLLSFLLLMVGLSSLSAVLFSNSPYYLSGGFIGGVMEQLFGDNLGQIFMLLCAMLFTSIGFYFCSGQIILHELSRLYAWIFNSKTTETERENEAIAIQNDDENAAQADDILQNSANSEPLAESELGDLMETKHPEPEPMTVTMEKSSDGFTNPANFSRPNIIGLKKNDAPATAANASITAVPQAEQGIESLVDLADFAISQDELPKVEMPTVSLSQVAKPTPSIPSAQIATADKSENVLPTVRINAAADRVAEPVAAVDVAIDDDNEPEVVMPTMPKVQLEPRRVEEKVASVEPEMEKPAFLDSPRVSLKPVEEAPENTQEAAPTVEQATSKAAPSYPKGYGDSLVHPLLQQATKLEKPTTPLPTLDLLTTEPNTAPQMTEQEIREVSRRIEQELANFGVKATVEDVLVGPVVTRYEILPAAGVKASKINNLESDLARALIFKAIRITDVVPGKPYMGIEAPNTHRETVWLRDVLASDAFIHSKAILPMALGKDISGEPVVVDMAKMPHLLVAGQTGGGKSVGVNTMILSLLYKFSPEQVRFIMIDPKVVELSIYNDIPHLLTPVVTDMKKAENALRWAVEEMERRYLLVSKLSVRNIEGYNDKIEQAAEMGLPIPNPIWRPGDTMDALPPPLEKLSYIVLVVDEFADLMMTAGKQVEDHIMRIAQKARAVGIHLILATQRPSTDVITGTIKSNIPSRVAFTVASSIDSRTILDKTGAESLLGRGDMLYSAAGNPEIIRVHGAFMKDEDVQKVADNWRARGKPNYIDSIVESADDEGASSGERGGSGDLDPLFDEIAQFMIDGGATSISGIQRRFSLGFNRAARIIDQLEEEGILSAADSRGKREVLAR